MSALCMCTCGSSACVNVSVFLLSVLSPTLPYPTLPYPTLPYPTLPYHVLSRYSLLPSPYNCLLFYSALFCPLVLHKDVCHRCKRSQFSSCVSECDIQSIRNSDDFLRYVLVRTVLILLISACTVSK